MAINAGQAQIARQCKEDIELGLRTDLRKKDIPYIVEPGNGRVNGPQWRKKAITEDRLPRKGASIYPAPSRPYWGG